MTLEARALTLGYGEREVVHGASLRAERGELLALIGPNGSGKSTLLRGLARLLRPRAGDVRLDGDDLWSLGSRAVARQIAILPQSPDGGLDFTVEELVSRGRYPHQSLLRGIGARDVDAINRALRDADLEGLRGRRLGTLSGGERQRAWIALALAQEPRFLLLDEPTAFLDVRHSIEVMELLRRLNAAGMTVIAVLHDLMLAARYADRVAALSDGRLRAYGTPEDVFRAELLRAVFAIEMSVIADPVTGRPLPLPGVPRPAAATRD
ncbi:MAG: ABC transporter ATP-binding protein [Chloroflexi bacterium]|nr:ABC transporter ATP-binding protein [Chloroflexota bacterium]